jgi:hypothetical protein
MLLCACVRRWRRLHATASAAGASEGPRASGSQRRCFMILGVIRGLDSFHIFWGPRTHCVPRNGFPQAKGKHMERRPEGATTAEYFGGGMAEAHR